MTNPSPGRCRRTLAGIVIAAALAALCLPALAVEDGLGTNVVKNLRVKDGGTLSLGGTTITNWSDVSGSAIDQTARDTATYASNTANSAKSDAATADAKAVTADGKAVAAQGAADAAAAAAGVADGKAVAAQATATYASNTANSAKSDAATAQATATYASNTANSAKSDAATADGKAVAAQGAADAAAAAAGVADGKAVAAQATASAATNGLTLKYDKAGGTISGNVTFGSNIVHAVNSQLALDTEDSINPANVSVVKIAGTSGAVTDVGIAPGTEGQVLTLIGTDNTKTVQIVASTNVVLTEGVDFTMGSNAVLQVIYTGAKWAEMHRATPN